MAGTQAAPLQVAELVQNEQGVIAAAAEVAVVAAAFLIAMGGTDARMSYVRKLVTELSGGVFGYLDSVLERHSFDEFGELI